MSQTQRVKLSIVTGANQGIGYEIAKQLYASQAGGKKVQPQKVVLACRSLDRGNDAVKKIFQETKSHRQAAGENAVFVDPVVLQMDLSKPASFPKFAKEVQDLNAGPVDSLINNAAILDNNLDLKEMTEVVKINYTNTITFVQEMLPLMRVEKANDQEENITSRVVLMGSRYMGSVSAVPNRNFGSIVGNPKKLMELQGGDVKAVLDEQMSLYLQALQKGDMSWNSGYGPAYIVSKALVNAWWRMQPILAAEAAKQSKNGGSGLAAAPASIGWYSCCPGWVPTNMTRHASAAPTPVHKAADTPVWLASGANADTQLVNGGFYGERNLLSHVTGQNV